MTACSDPVSLPPEFGARPLADGDVGAAMRLSSEAGWNQTERDWRLMLGIGNGIGIVRAGAERGLIATAVTIPYGEPVPRDAAPFGWISMVLVAAAWRRRGLATWLLDRSIAQLRAQGRIAVLDATPAGRGVYRLRGFQDGPTLERLETTAPAPDAGVPLQAVEIRRVRADDFDALRAFDAPAFGGDRAAVLAHLAERWPEAAQLALRDRRIVGYVLARDGHRATQIGPLVAPDSGAAITLFEAAWRATAGPVFTDAVVAQAAFCRHLRHRGFTVQRTFTRMSLGGPVPGDRRDVFLAAGPELG